MGQLMMMELNDCGNGIDTPAVSDGKFELWRSGKEKSRKTVLQSAVMESQGPNIVGGDGKVRPPKSFLLAHVCEGTSLDLSATEKIDSKRQFPQDPSFHLYERYELFLSLTWEQRQALRCVEPHLHARSHLRLLPIWE